MTSLRGARKNEKKTKRAKVRGSMLEPFWTCTHAHTRAHIFTRTHTHTHIRPIVVLYLRREQKRVPDEAKIYERGTVHGDNMVCGQRPATKITCRSLGIPIRTPFNVEGLPPPDKQKNLNQKTESFFFCSGGTSPPNIEGAEDHKAEFQNEQTRIQQVNFVGAWPHTCAKMQHLTINPYTCTPCSFLCTHTYTHTHIHTHTHLPLSSAHTHTHIHTYTHIHTHSPTPTHTHTRAHGHAPVQWALGYLLDLNQNTSFPF